MTAKEPTHADNKATPKKSRYRALFFPPFYSYRIPIACFLAVLLLDTAYTFIGYRSGFLPAMEKRVYPADGWVVNEKGDIIASRTGREPPEGWHRLLNNRAEAGRKNHLGTIVIPDSRDPHLYWLIRPFAPSLRRGLMTWLYRGFPVTALGFLLNAWLCVFYLQSRARRAEGVMHAIERGEFGTRIPVDRIDEIGGLMGRFNEMADKVEQLIEKLRLSEQSRNQLIQELTHDLRTPLTSVYMLIGSIVDPDSSYSIEEIRSMMEYAQKDLEYFRKLIDDLFLIAQVNDPTSKKGVQEIDLVGIMKGEIERMKKTAGLLGGSVDFELTASCEFFMRADAHLIQRLFRNALENSARFAKSKVQIRFENSAGGEAVVSISDDGPGFSPGSIESFGRKRPTRVFDMTKSGRISLGLGSVIMSTIAEAYGGRIVIENHTHSARGAKVRIFLPAIAGCARMAS